MQPHTYRLSLFCLIFGLALSAAFDVYGQLFRRLRTVQPTQTTVCGPEGCVAYPSTTVYQSRPLLPDIQRTYVQPAASALASSGTLLQPVAISAEEVRSDFHRSLLKAAQSAARKGEISRVQVIRLRAAMLMPAFRAQAEEMARVQIAASGEESPAVEFNEQGGVSRIDWDALLEFLEKLIPIILQLITIFSGLS